MSQGSVAEFKANWQRPEAEYCHFTRGEPENQIQFAFRQNWLEFSQIIEHLKPWDGKKSLEVGAGRGTMSMYFADAGFDVTLLDACEEPLEHAKKQFARHDLECTTVVGDAMKLPFDDESFDVVFSYGLLEHFEDEELGHVMQSQFRVLRRGGLWIGYVAYEPNSMFPGMSAVTAAIRCYSHIDERKSDVFRRENKWARVCVTGCARHFLSNVRAYDVYPFPMIAPSVEFPFTLNPPEIERAIVQEFKDSDTRWLQDPCDGEVGPCQAFLVWGTK